MNELLVILNVVGVLMMVAGAAIRALDARLEEKLDS